MDFVKIMHKISTHHLLSSILWENWLAFCNFMQSLHEVKKLTYNMKPISYWMSIHPTGCFMSETTNQNSMEYGNGY